MDYKKQMDYIRNEYQSLILIITKDVYEETKNVLKLKFNNYKRHLDKLKYQKSYAKYSKQITFSIYAKNQHHFLDDINLVFFTEDFNIWFPMFDERELNTYTVRNSLIYTLFDKFNIWFNDKTIKYFSEHQLYCILNKIKYIDDFDNRKKIFQHFWNAVIKIKYNIPYTIKRDIVIKFSEFIDVWYCEDMKLIDLMIYMIFEKPNHSFVCFTKKNLKYILDESNIEKFLDIYKYVDLKNKQYIYNSIRDKYLAIKLLKEI